MSFKYKGSLDGGARTLVKIVLDDSTMFRIGDVVTSSGTTDDAVILATSGVRVLGVIAGIVDANGMPPADDGASGTFVDKYTTASTNTTAKYVSALVDVNTNSLYSEPTGSTLGTTTGSNKKFYFLDVNSVTTGTTGSTLTESSASTTSKQFFSFGLDPEDTTRIIVKIKESLLLGDSGY